MLLSLLDRLHQGRVLVAGDAMLDRYWYGGVERISPEAPVPVVAVGRAEERPGGAANVARNVAGLGSRCALVSASGDDAAADSLEKLVRAAGIECSLVRDALVNTTVKLRVISRNQQLIRIDFETQASKDTRRRLLDAFLARLPEVDAVVVSDYGKGGLGHVQEMIRAARARGLPVLVDPKGDDYEPYRGATLITPNRKEFEHAAGRARDEAELERKAQAMLDALALDGLLVTRSEEGMSLFRKGAPALHVPAQAREVYDVTGAGDTVIGVLGAAFAVGAPVEDAVRIANLAAGIVVGKLGAAAVSPEEIRRELQEVPT